MTYVVAYAFVIAGTFAIIGVVAGAREQNDSLATMKGLAKKEPYLAGCMTILLFSHAGMPLTSGFIAKFDVFRIAFQQHFYITGVIVLIATVIAAAFYLQIVLAMYADSFDGEAQGLGDSGIDFALGARIAIGACVAITMLIGVFPQLLTGLTHAL
jgi:NADH-quinone oxidoreductase subunit N